MRILVSTLLLPRYTILIFFIYFFFYFFLIFNIILYLEKQFLKKTLENTR